MSKKLFVLAAAILFTIAGWSQTLFTYGKNTVDTRDFLRAYEKNKTDTKEGKTKAIKDYLDLYVRSRLKIQEAYSRGYDTLPQIKSEVDNLRQQIIDETQLPISFGLASNKMMAKIATDEAKPNGYLQVPFGKEKEFLAPSSMARSIPSSLNKKLPKP